MMQTIMNTWGEPGFRQLFRDHLCQLDEGVLPLQQGLQHSSVALLDKIDAMILSEDENSQEYRVKVGVFYRGVISGCSCADDPTPVVEQTEYCEVLCRIDKQSYTMQTTLIAD